MEPIEVLENQAIDAAINANWQKAIELNEKIIAIDKKNIDAYLRLAFAYLQKNDLKKAKKIYNKAKKIQPNNYLIKENLEKIKILEQKKISQLAQANLNPNIFIDVPGKTKTINLVNCGQKTTLVKLSIGQEVFLNIKKKRVEVRTKNKEYIGCLPDDISRRIAIFIKAGSLFKAYIKDVSLKSATVFLKEEKKGKRVAKYAPFPIVYKPGINNINLEQEEDIEEISDNDLEKLAESLSEEKEYYGFTHEEKEDEEIEE